MWKYRLYRKIYQNVVLIGNDEPDSYTVSSMDVQIGKTNQTGQEGQFLKGNIAQVLIYDVALTEEQIIDNFVATKSKFGY